MYIPRCIIYVLYATVKSARVHNTPAFGSRDTSVYLHTDKRGRRQVGCSVRT